MTTYWDRIGTKPFVTYKELKYCACGKIAVQVEAKENEKMLLSNEGFPAFLCEEHKREEGTEVKYKLPNRFRLLSLL